MILTGQRIRGGTNVTGVYVWTVLRVNMLHLFALLCRSTMLGGPRQGAASTEDGGIGPQTHSSKRQPRGSHAQGERGGEHPTVRVLSCFSWERVCVNAARLPPQLYQKMAVLRSLCSLHMEKLRWFSQRYPLTVHSHFPPLYKELFASEADLLPGNTH